MFKKLKNNNSGFTVLELVTVTAIMVALLVLVVTNFRGFDINSALELEADKISSVLRQAQILALTGQTVSGQRYNYGAHFEECVSESCNYILFFDNNNNKFYNFGEEYGQGIFQIATGVKINSLSPVAGINLDIVFEAPLGDAYFNDSISEDQARIILKHDKSSAQKIISVDRVSGRINIQ